jgi:phospholipid/cholesterol/gamma-HCH transport system substrate-binding protein
MNESPSRQAVVVGLFVTIGLVILAGGVATIGGLNDRFTRQIHVHATFADVGGLQVGDNVWFSGVQVGTVRSVAFDPKSQVEVELSVEESASAFIHGDAKAKIGSDGLIGNTIVVLYGGTETAGSLKDEAVLTTTTGPSTEDMFATLNANNENLKAITGDIKALTAKIASGQGSAGRLLNDDALYLDVKDTVATLRDASVQARAMSGNLAAFSGKLTQEGALADQIVSDRDTWGSFTASVDRLQSVTTAVAESTTQTTGPLGTLLNDPVAATDLRETLDNLNTSTGLLSENMEALQHNFLFRGYFKRRAKEQEVQEPEPEPEPEATGGDASAEPTP